MIKNTHTSYYKLNSFTHTRSTQTGMLEGSPHLVSLQTSSSSTLIIEIPRYSSFDLDKNFLTVCLSCPSASCNITFFPSYFSALSYSWNHLQTAHWWHQKQAQTLRNNYHGDQTLLCLPEKARILEGFIEQLHQYTCISIEGHVAKHCRLTMYM